MKGLETFIKELETDGELIRIKEKVSPILEITEIIDRLSKSNNCNKAVLFENTGSNFPVLINAYGSEKRMAYALGMTSLQEAQNYIESFFSLLHKTQNNKSFFQKLKILFSLKEIAGYMPKKIKGKGICQQNIITENIDINILPILKLWTNDGGKYITLPAVHTTNPYTENRNVGMYRMQVLDNKTTAMHWQIHKDAASHFSLYKEKGIKKMPVAVILGGDPVYAYVASAPLPEDIDEYIFAGILRKKPVHLVKAITQNIYVPEDADIVIEGYVDTTEDFVLEGPFGDHTGFYSLEDYYPKFHITAITHKNNAVYPATIVGIPPQEDKYIAEATGKIFLPLFKNTMLPELVDWHMPDFGVAHNLVIASVKTWYPHQSYKIAHTFWGAGQMSFNKTLILIPHYVKPNDYKTIASMISNIDIDKNIYFGKGILDVLDHACYEKAFGGKMLIDLTNVKQEKIASNIQIEQKDKNLLYIPTYKTIIIKSEKEQVVDCLNKYLVDIKENIKFAFCVDKKSMFENYKLLLWYILANIDVSRDIKKISNTLVIDGRIKNKTNFMNKWPMPDIMSEDIVKTVNKKWDKYNVCKDFLKSPSQKLWQDFNILSPYKEI